MSVFPPVLIVAHGQPSDPEPAAAELAALAGRIGGHLEGWRVASATLAEADALGARVAEMGEGGLVYPLFMAGGWFTKTHLPERLRAVGATDWRVMEPFGLDPLVQDLAEGIVREAGLGAGGALLLAAHGSFRSPAPSEVAIAVAERIGRALGLARSEAAFIDQEPQLSQARGFDRDAVCLPFFAARGGHVIDDLPRALEEAGFEGRVLPALGLDARVPATIARAIRTAAAAALT